MNNHAVILEQAIDKIIDKYPRCSKGRGNNVLKTDRICVLYKGDLPLGENTEETHVRVVFHQLEGQTSRLGDNTKIEYIPEKYTTDAELGVELTTFLITYSR